MAATPERLPVSVVIPAYRRPQMVERAIRSVLAQRPAPAEVLVVDDGSGDDTGARAESLGARVVMHETNLGEGAARNTGLTEASNEWVALLDSDDEWLPGHLATLWAARNGHVLVGTAVQTVGPGPWSGQVFGYAGRRPRRVHQPADVLVPHNDFNSNAVLLRRDAALAAGGFRTDLARAADLDMWVRLLERGSAVKIPRVTAVYHLHESQVSPPDPAAMRRAHRAVLDSYAGRPWHTQTLVARHEGAVAWDEAREALAQGRPRRRVLMRLLRVLASPARARGVLELLLARRRRRALAVRLAAAAPPGALRGSGRLRERISYRIRHHTRLALLGAFGRPVRCSECGGELFRAIVFVRHGRVWIYGAAESTVRVAFADREALQFRHMELDRCPTSARPWLERPEVPPVSPRP